MTDVTAFIFARGGSKGLPNKNILPLAGKPLIGWAIEQALAVSKIARVMVSTDSSEIAEIARSYGAEVPFLRPEELAGDKASELEAWRHSLRYLKETEGELPDIFLSVPTTSPLRLPQDIENCMNLYIEEGADFVLTATPSHRNPWFNMIGFDENGCAKLVNNPDAKVTRRQDAPEVFDICTVAYAGDPNYILRCKSLFEGKVLASRVPIERSIDIDNRYDFEIAEFLMNKRLGSMT